MKTVDALEIDVPFGKSVLVILRPGGRETRFTDLKPGKFLIVRNEVLAWWFE